MFEFYDRRQRAWSGTFSRPQLRTAKDLLELLLENARRKGEAGRDSEMQPATSY